MFSQIPAWLQRAERSGKGHLLRQLLDLATRYNLYMAPPHYVLYHSTESTIPFNDVRVKVLAAVGGENLELLADLEMSGLASITPRQLPFTKPDDCCVRIMERTSHYEVYPNRGTGWQLTNPSRTCTFLCQSGISIRQLVWDTLVPKTRLRTVIGASQVRDYYTQPMIEGTEVSQDEMEGFKSEVRPILDRTRIRAEWYDLPDMVKRDRIRLAVSVSKEDFEDQILERRMEVTRDGWEVRKMTIKRNQQGKVEGCWPSD